MPINEPAFKRPDPLIYSQSYLMGQGLAVTWDNPDIQLYRNGHPVPSAMLEPDTEYEVVARVWNGSTEAPIVGLPVRFSYLSFGVGTQTHPIGDVLVDLGVIGGPNHPAFAHMAWRTPASAGHYCLQVLLDWAADLNPNNNLGQENTSVGTPHSPVEFAFTLRNPALEQRRFWFEVDSYRIPRRLSCKQWDVCGEERRGKIQTIHDRLSHPVPDGWHVDVSPPELELSPGQEQAIRVVIDAPDGFTSTQPINVNAFTEFGPAGGVTLYVEVGSP